MAASGEKRSRRKLPAGGSVANPMTAGASTDETPTPATLPGLPGAPALPRASRKAMTKPTATLPLVADTAERTADQAADAAESATATTDAVADQAVETAEEAASQVADTAQEVAETATDTVDILADEAAEAAETAVEQRADLAEEVGIQVEAAAATVADTVQTGVDSMADAAAAPIEQAAQAAPITHPFKQEVTIMDTIQNTTEKTQAYFADANERARGTMEKSARFFQEMTEFSKGNVEAVVESSKIAARGFETMGQDAAAYFKTSFEEASQALRTLATIKSPAELMKFQADYVRSSFDAMVAQTSRGTEASLKLAGEVVQPISNRVAVAAEKIKVSA